VLSAQKMDAHLNNLKKYLIKFNFTYMFCEKCGKNIPDNSIFCEFCGNKIMQEEIVTEKIVKSSEGNNKNLKVIQNENLKQITNHLEFLGYEVRKLDIEGEREFIFAKHAKNNNVIFWEMFPNFVMFKVSLTTEKKASSKIDAFINNANKNLEISKFYYDIDDNILTLRFEATYVGVYVKETFGQFHELFENDQKRACSLDDFSKLFVG